MRSIRQWAAQESATRRNHRGRHRWAARNRRLSRMFQAVRSPVPPHLSRLPFSASKNSFDQFGRLRWLCLRTCRYWIPRRLAAPVRRITGQDHQGVADSTRGKCVQRGSKYVTFEEPRVFERETLTTKPSTENVMTGTNDHGHIVGYTATALSCARQSDSVLA